MLHVVLTASAPELARSVHTIAEQLSVALRLADAAVPIHVHRGQIAEGFGWSRDLSNCAHEPCAVISVTTHGPHGAPSGTLSGRDADPLDGFGLCAWKLTAAKALVAEPQSIAVQSEVLANPGALATMLRALQGLLDGDAHQTLECLNALVPLSESGPLACTLTYWRALAHLEIGQRVGDTSQFDAATTHCGTALSTRNPVPSPIVAASIYRRLAQSRYQRPSGDLVAQRAAARTAIGRGLALTGDTYPIESARLLYERASIALYELGAGNERAAREASADLRDALKTFTQHGLSLERSHCLNALGRVEAASVGRDLRRRQARAQSHYEDALIVRTRARHPWHFAQTQHNLGCLLLQRAAGTRHGNADAAVRCFLEALSVFDGERFPHRHRQTLGGLGRAYLQRNGESGFDLQRAIACFQGVLGSVTALTFPYLYARTRYDLGTALALRAGRDGAELSAAIDCYRDALTGFSIAEHPADRANVLVALAGALIAAAAAGRGNAIAEALQHYTEAMAVFGGLDRSADIACVQACLATILLAGNPPPDSPARVAAETYRLAARDAIDNGTVYDTGGAGVDDTVRALLTTAGPITASPESSTPSERTNATNRHAETGS